MSDILNWKFKFRAIAYVDASRSKRQDVTGIGTVLSFSKDTAIVMDNLTGKLHCVNVEELQKIKEEPE